MKPAKKITTAFDRLLDFLGFCDGILVALMMVGISVEVAMRHFFNRPTAWMIEVTQWALVFMLFLGAAWVLKKEGHVAIDLFLIRMKPQSRNLTIGITSLVCALVCLIITWYGIRVNIDYFQTRYRYPATLRIPAYLLQAVVPFGAFLFFIQFLRRAFSHLSKQAETTAAASKGADKP